jgi:hypothetical protein
MNLGMSLIEVLPVEGIDANLDRPSADTTQHGGPYRYSMSTMNPPARMKTGQHLLLTIRLKNLSDVTWSQRGQTGSQYPVTIGNHWLDLENRMIKHDDGRSTIPRDLNPQEETELPLSVIAPSTPGEYVLEIDMLIEGVTWFSQAGAKTARLHVSVEP